MDFESLNYFSLESILDCYKLINRKKAELNLIHLKESMKQTRSSVESVLQELSLRYYDNDSNRNKELINNIRFELTNIDALFENIDQPFSIFIVGSGKFGKSTLLNALIGQKLVMMDVIPKT